MFLEGMDAFDPAAFRLTAPEALAMDPQQRQLLEQTAVALQDARPAVGSLAGERRRRRMPRHSRLAHSEARVLRWPRACCSRRPSLLPEN